MVLISAVWQKAPVPCPPRRGRKHFPPPVLAEALMNKPDNAAGGHNITPLPPPLPQTARRPARAPRSEQGSLLEIDDHTVNICWPALNPKRKYVKTPADFGRCAALADLSVRFASSAHGKRIAPLFDQVFFATANGSAFHCQHPDYHVVTPRLINEALAGKSPRGDHPTSRGASHSLLGITDTSGNKSTVEGTPRAEQQHYSPDKERLPPASLAAPSQQSVLPLSTAMRQFNDTISSAASLCAVDDDAWSGSGTPRNNPMGLSRLPRLFDSKATLSVRRTRALTKNLPQFGYVESIYSQASHQSKVDNSEMEELQSEFEQVMLSQNSTNQAIGTFELEHMLH